MVPKERIVSVVPRRPTSPQPPRRPTSPRVAPVMTSRRRMGADGSHRRALGEQVVQRKLSYGRKASVSQLGNLCSCHMFSLRISPPPVHTPSLPAALR